MSARHRHRFATLFAWAQVRQAQEWARYAERNLPRLIAEARATEAKEIRLADRARDLLALEHAL